MWFQTWFKNFFPSRVCITPHWPSTADFFALVENVSKALPSASKCDKEQASVCDEFRIRICCNMCKL